jgi:hypothetical protein
MTSQRGGTEPIACSLNAGSFQARADEWRALVASSVASLEADDRAVAWSCATRMRR